MKEKKELKREEDEEVVVAAEKKNYTVVQKGKLLCSNIARNFKSIIN
jgi:hypothetical protein